MAVDIRYQVFLSSTYEDLRLERQQVTQTILEMGHQPTGMELFPASDLSQWELIRRVIDDSDYYIVILSGRYGSQHKDTGVSFTEMEYDYAVATHKPVLGFVRTKLEDLPAKHVDNDPGLIYRLNKFREKVLQRHCRHFNDSSELGLLVMKSLMSETRINPQLGWIKADQARSKDDEDREKAIAEALVRSEEKIRRLERRVRDIALPLEDLSSAELAKGTDPAYLTVSFQTREKTQVSLKIELTWDGIFKVIGASMYGYIVRRAKDNFGTAKYPFEERIVEYIRSVAFDQVGNRQVKLVAHELDAMMLQLKQLGLVEIMENNQEGDSPRFRGYTLTEYGEEYLTRISVMRTPKTV